MPDPAHSKTTVTPTRLEDVSNKLLLRALFGVALLLLSLAVIKELSDLLKTLLVASFLAIAADTLVRQLQRKGLSRNLSITAVLGSVVLLAAIIAVLVVPKLLAQGADLVDQAPAIAKEFQQSDGWQKFSSRFDIGDRMIQAFQRLMVGIPQAVAGTLGTVVNGVFGLVTMFFAVAFLLTGGGGGLRTALRLSPRLGNATGWKVVTGAYTNIGRYVVGATIQAILAGVSLTIVLFIVGVGKYAIPLGVLMLILDYVPLVGATIGAIPAVAVALFAGGTTQGIIVLVFVIAYQQVENAIIQPRIQAKSVNLPGVAIFFSVLVGGQLLGVVGALFAVPVASIVQIALNEYFVFTGRDKLELPRLFDDKGNPIAN